MTGLIGQEGTGGKRLSPGEKASGKVKRIPHFINSKMAVSSHLNISVSGRWDSTGLSKCQST